MTMYMESPIVRARELRRHDLLEDAARHRMATAASAIECSGIGRVTWIRSSGVNLIFRARANLARRLRAASRPVSAEAAVLAER